MLSQLGMFVEASFDMGGIRFSGLLRPSQVDASKAIDEGLGLGSKKFNIVAPPGSGKTILGLYSWSDMIRKPALVLSPNSAIQAQWAARAKDSGLFDLNGKECFISTNPKKPGLLTSLTYQSVTLPKKADFELEIEALDLWIDRLIMEEEASDPSGAKAWIEDLRTRNPTYYKKRFSTYTKKVRDLRIKSGEVEGALHASSLDTLSRLSETGVGMVILDECHHLLHHWGWILDSAMELLGNPIVVGLTATPPDPEDVDEKDWLRYREFFGEVDYEVPVPALVREGNLSPYQDLCYFVRPDGDELDYLEQVDKGASEILLKAMKNRGNNRIPPIDIWIREVFQKRILPTGRVSSRTAFRNADPTFFDAAPQFLDILGLEGIPDHVAHHNRLTLLEAMGICLDRYVRWGLIRSENVEDHSLAGEITAQLRLLGVQITETGSRACASPITRILAYSSSKSDALSDILDCEINNLGLDKIRAVVITDFEKSSATSIVEGVQDNEAGGAVAAFRSILSDTRTDSLDPILVTGSTVLVDDDLAENFLSEAKKWVSERDLSIRLEDRADSGYHGISGSGKDWVTRNYIEMITEMFQRGLTRCLVGTRGLLGEGWDASRINVLVDLTTVTTSMSINQLRGRSFRLDKTWPDKVANNWDVVCIAEEYMRGFDDFERFRRKHAQLYGVGDDGTIEKGVGHVHAAFSDLEREFATDESGRKHVVYPEIRDGMQLFNEDMLLRSSRRNESRNSWGIGNPFEGVPMRSLELKSGAGLGRGFPPGAIRGAEWNDESILEAMGVCVLGTGISLGIFSETLKPSGGNRGGGWIRIHLDGASEEESRIYSKAMEELLGPLDDARYLIPRWIKTIHPTFLSKMLPGALGRIFERKENNVAMVHRVPTIFASKKDDAQDFQLLWNRFVSTGSVVYARGEIGKMALADAKQHGYEPTIRTRGKDVFR